MSDRDFNTDLWFKDWKESREIDQNNLKEIRLSSFRRNGLTVDFNDFIPNQTYTGYIDYYASTVNLFYREILRGFRQESGTIIYAFQLELECRVAKIMRDYCV